MSSAPLRIAHLADTHIGMENYGRLNPESGLNQRLHDFLNSLDQALDGAIAAGVDLVVFAGDIYKTRDPTPTHQREFARRIRLWVHTSKRTRYAFFVQVKWLKISRAMNCLCKIAVRENGSTWIFLREEEPFSRSLS